MGETDLQLGGGYKYQWECAILLALNHFFIPSLRYSPPLSDLITRFLPGGVEEIILEGENRADGIDLEDINLIAGDRRILIQVKTKQAEDQRWTLADPLLLKAFYRFYKNYSSAQRPADARFVFLTNSPFNPDLVKINSQIKAGKVGESGEAKKFYAQLKKYTQKAEQGQKKAGHQNEEQANEITRMDVSRFQEMLSRTVMVKYLDVDVVKANIQALLSSGSRDWLRAEHSLFDLFAAQSTRVGGGVITRSLLIELLPFLEDIKQPETYAEAPSQVSGQPLSGEHAAASVNIPPKNYHELIGRQDKLDEIMSALREPANKPVIAITGLGGIGKTALAREVVDRSLEEELFECIVWTSYKTEQFVGERITPIESADNSFGELLSEIGRQCHPEHIPRMAAGQKRAGDIARLSPDQRKAAVKKLLNKKPVLIVLDNLETIRETENLVANVLEISGRSKILITSRHLVNHERVYNLQLRGLSEDAGVTFLREESQQRGIEIVAQAGRSILVNIHVVTGGAPLAMKLVIGQMSRLPVEVVLDTLKAASSQGQDYAIYRFIYRYSWGMLDKQARMVLVDMSEFPPLTGGAVEDVESISQVAGPAFWPAMDQLVRLSLVDKLGKLGNERFALHPLTQYFIRSDITREWNSLPSV